MYDAWNKGISTYEFRKCYMKDLRFIKEMNKAFDIRRDKIVQEEKVKNIMEQMAYGRR